MLRRIGRVFGISAPINQYKTDSGNPPHTPPSKARSGNYCFKAETHAELNGEEKLYVYGYSPDFDIASKVDEICERSRQPRERCQNTRLSFIGEHPECNGEVKTMRV